MSVCEDRGFGPQHIVYNQLGADGCSWERVYHDGTNWCSEIIPKSEYDPAGVNCHSAREVMLGLGMTTQQIETALTCMFGAGTCGGSGDNTGKPAMPLYAGPFDALSETLIGCVWNHRSDIRSVYITQYTISTLRHKQSALNNWWSNTNERNQFPDANTWASNQGTCGSGSNLPQCISGQRYDIVQKKCVSIQSQGTWSVQQIIDWINRNKLPVGVATGVIVAIKYLR